MKEKVPSGNTFYSSCSLLQQGGALPWLYWFWLTKFKPLGGVPSYISPEMCVHMYIYMSCYIRAYINIYMTSFPNTKQLLLFWEQKINKKQQLGESITREKSHDFFFFCSTPRFWNCRHCCYLPSREERLSFQHSRKIHTAHEQQTDIFQMLLPYCVHHVHSESNMPRRYWA